MSKCLTCDSSLETFISFGTVPLANAFLDVDEFEDERLFDLDVAFCASCSMVQLAHLAPPDQLFHQDYAYLSSTSKRMISHFRRFAEDVRNNYLADPDPFVVEIGSNDGILLRNFAAWDVRHLGVEPSANVASLAADQGVNTLCSFFDDETAGAIRATYGPADAILGANVIGHIPDIHSVFRGVTRLLKNAGIFIFEQPYLGDIIDKVAYDQIYHEHVFYFSITALGNALEPHGMTVVDAQPNEVHGGSMRYFIARKGEIPVHPRVYGLHARETSLGLTNEATFHTFAQNVTRSRDRFTALLRELKAENKKIVGYGATAKSTTVTNFCKISADLIDYISDTTPTKQGKFSPGMHIPIVPHERFLSDNPDFAVLFAWNHGEEIIANEKPFLDRGGRFITYVPSVSIIEQD